MVVTWKGWRIKEQGDIAVLMNMQNGEVIWELPISTLPADYLGRARLIRDYVSGKRDVFKSVVDALVEHITDGKTAGFTRTDIG